MSHVTEIKTQVFNLETLAQASEQLGLEFVHGQRTFRSYFDRTKERCDHAIRVPGNSAAYEVGVKAQADGSFQLLFDDWNGGFGLLEKIGQGAGLLLQRYAIEEAKRLARTQGYSVTESLCEDGSVELEILTEVA